MEEPMLNGSGKLLSLLSGVQPLFSQAMDLSFLRKQPLKELPFAVESSRS